MTTDVLPTSDFHSRISESRADQDPESFRHLVQGREIHNILYVIDELCQLGGAERNLFEIVRRLPRDRFSPSICVFRMQSELEQLRNVSAPIHLLPLNRTYDLNALNIALRLRRIIRTHKISIVHTFFETSDLWAGPIARLSGCSNLISSRRDMGILRRLKHRLAYPVANPLFTRILAVSEQVRLHCMKEGGVSDSRVETLYNGIDVAAIDDKAALADARQDLGIPNGIPVISTIANVRLVKGIDVLLRAASLVCRRFPSAMFLVIGKALEPQTMNSLRKQVESLQLQSNVRFLGAVHNPFPILKASNAFCLPSRSEGLSNALLEAMACGIPSVVTSVGGNREVLVDEECGYVVASEDYQKMADRIGALLADRSLAAKMGCAARAMVQRRFSMQTMMNRLVQIYEEVVAA